MLKKTCIIFLVSFMLLRLICYGEPFIDQKVAEKKLQDKYQEAFQIVDYRRPNIFRDYYTVYVRSTAYQDILFRADIDRNFSNMSDNYVSKRLCRRISEKITENLQSVGYNFYVFTENTLDNTLLTDVEIPLADYLKESPGTSFVIHVFLDKEKGKLENLAANMLNGIPGLNGSVCVYLADSDLLKEVKTYTSSYNELYEDFEDMTEEFLLGQTDFENSSIFFPSILDSSVSTNVETTIPVPSDAVLY